MEARLTLPFAQCKGLSFAPYACSACAFNVALYSAGWLRLTHRATASDCTVRCRRLNNQKTPNMAAASLTLLRHGTRLHCAVPRRCDRATPQLGLDPRSKETNAWRVGSYYYACSASACTNRPTVQRRTPTGGAVIPQGPRRLRAGLPHAAVPTCVSSIPRQ